MKQLNKLFICLFVFILTVSLVHAEDKGEILSAETRTGSLTSVVQTDSFTFTGEAGQGVVITMSRESGELNPVIDLYDPYGKWETNAYTIYGATAKLDKYQLLQSDGYTIVVSDCDINGTGSYSLSLLLIPGPTVSTQDPDGGEIYSGEIKTGTIDTYADTDAYTFNGEAGQGPVITMSRENGELNPVIDLYDPYGKWETNAYTIYGATAKLDKYQLLQSGGYTIVVSDCDCNGTGSYSLSLTGIIPDEYEPDDSNNQAKEITPNDEEPQNHNFHDTGDEDWVQFNGLGGYDYLITVTNPGAECNAVIELYDEDGTTLLESKNDTDKGGRESLSYKFDEDATYYVRVRNYDPTDVGESTRYDLRVFGGGTLGRITGRVMNASSEGSICPTVATITTDNIGFAISTCPMGEYAMLEMAGQWKISATADGYENDDSGSSVNVSAGVDTNHDISMSPSNTTTSSTDTSTTTSTNGGCTIILDPKTVKVKSEDSVSFTVYTSGDCSDPDYEWSVESDIGSVVDQNGNYVAGTNDAPFNKAIDVVMVDDHANDTDAVATVTVSWRCPLQQIYGENSEEVAALRSFRDNVLSQTPEGREIVKLYYQWGPLIIQEMENDEKFKEEVKEVIDGVLMLIRTEVE